MPESITAFDGIALAVVVISAIMGFARGFLRELATLGAFIGALAAAYYARAFFHDDLAALLPPDMAPWTADLILVIAAFVIVHVYLLTVGHGFRAHVKPMITGYDEVDLTAAEEAYLEADEPWRLKPREG